MGNLTLNGATSGQITLAPTAVAGTNTLTLPASTGTVALTNTTVFNSATTLSLQTASTTALYIDASQNVGIGTSSPAYKLDVQSTSSSTASFARATGQSVVKIQGIGGSSVLGFGDGTAIGNTSTWAIGRKNSDNSFRINYNEDSLDTTNYLTINTAGSVGIGTTSPSYNLEVYSSGALLAGITRATTSTDAGAIFSFSTLNASSAKTSMADIVGASSTTTAGAENGYMSLRTKTSGSMTEKVRIDSSGNLLVGTTSVIQGGKVSISGVCSGQNNGASFSANQTNATGDQFYFRTNSGANLAGYITCPTSTTTNYTSVSDYRLKENVQPMATGLATISALKPVTYDWISDKSVGEGFIAHELQSVIPLAVTGEKDAVDDEGNIKPQGVDYSKIVVHLVAAMQEQQAQITSLKAELDALKGTK